MCFALVLWKEPTMDRLKSDHTHSMPLVWTSPTTHCSALWLTLSCRRVSVSMPR